MTPELLIGGVASIILVVALIATLTKSKRTEYPSDGHSPGSGRKPGGS